MGGSIMSQKLEDKFPELHEDLQVSFGHYKIITKVSQNQIESHIISDGKLTCVLPGKYIEDLSHKEIIQHTQTHHQRILSSYKNGLSAPIHDEQSHDSMVHFQQTITEEDAPHQERQTRELLPVNAQSLKQYLPDSIITDENQLPDSYPPEEPKKRRWLETPYPPELLAQDTNPSDIETLELRAVNDTTASPTPRNNVLSSQPTDSFSSPACQTEVDLDAADDDVTLIVSLDELGIKH